MTKFLYGATVQGIQSFIFQTDKLKEIAGGSELVEQTCTSLFAKCLGIKDLEQDPNALITAAGNIKYVFDDEETCKKLVLEFPKSVMEFAPGITLSQAVLPLSDGKASNDSIEELECLLRAQRNKAFRPIESGLQAVVRSRRTGLPAIEQQYDKETKQTEYFDWGAVEKRKAIKKEIDKQGYGRLVKNFFGENMKLDLPLNLEEITKSKGANYNWLAIIHADGNNLGLLIQQMFSEVKEKGNDSGIGFFRSFSAKLDEATKIAAQRSYKDVNDLFSKKDDDSGSETPTPRVATFRPIILGGDDITVICRADQALDFARNFLRYFKEETHNQFKDMGVECLKNGVTACAGIAFVKSSFPFHFGYELAEVLCKEAKKVSKDIASPISPSSLMFHKVQDSFVTDFESIKERELQAKNARIAFDYGPYFLEKQNQNQYTSIDDLLAKVQELNDEEGNAIKTHLRQWLTDLHGNKDLAEQKIRRLLNVANPAKLKKLELSELNNKNGLIVKRSSDDNKKINEVTPVFDWLTIYSINHGGA
jgi:hypothetical protein